VSQAAPAFSPQQSAGPEYRQLGLPGGMAWMLIGAILTVVRIFYVAGQLDNYSQGRAYNDGAMFGTVIGFLIGGILIGHGYCQYRDWAENPTVKPSSRIGWQVMPVAIPVAAAAFLLAWLMH
jgi:predicted transporter